MLLMLTLFSRCTVIKLSASPFIRWLEVFVNEDMIITRVCPLSYYLPASLPFDILWYPPGFCFSFAFSTIISTAEE